MPDDNKTTILAEINNESALCSGSLLLSTAYLPPISYFMAIVNSDNILIDAYENYTKQSYRNRCKIATGNGVETLSIPVESNGGNKTTIRDVRISYHGNWQRDHLRAITSAYRNSPYFEYLIDDFLPFFEKKWTFLWDYNRELVTLSLDILGTGTTIGFTENYIPRSLDNNDLRDIIHPKKAIFKMSKPYYQVFESRFGFIPDLSIIDLLFNMGNESILVLTN